MAQINDKILLTEDEVSKLFNINKHTLQRERFNGQVFRTLNQGEEFVIKLKILKNI